MSTEIIYCVCAFLLHRKGGLMAPCQKHVHFIFQSKVPALKNDFKILEQNSPLQIFHSFPFFALSTCSEFSSLPPTPLCFWILLSARKWWDPFFLENYAHQWVFCIWMSMKNHISSYLHCFPARVYKVLSKGTKTWNQRKMLLNSSCISIDVNWIVYMAQVNSCTCSLQPESS